MQMGGAGQVPYAPNMMGTPVQSSGYGMQSQPQYWTPLGPVTFQMAQCNMTTQMLLDQCVQMDILQYTGQHHQNQQQSQQQNQHQQYNTADRRTKQSSVDAGPAVFKWRQEDEEEERNDRKMDVSRVKVTPISISTASKEQNSQYLFMGQLEELNVPTSGGTAEHIEQTAQAAGRQMVL
jgi:hypothetical protein